MTRPVEEQSLAELIAGLASSIPRLLRDEVELLRSKLAFALRRMQAASGLLVVATALTMAAVLLMVAAAVSGLSLYLISLRIAPAAAVAIASLVAALISGALAATFVFTAGKELRRASAAVEQGIDAISGGLVREKVE